MVTERSRRPAASEKTKAALIEAGLTLFAEKGFAATSTREIAAAANANIASIAYHFGSKEGLRDACAAWIVKTVQAVAGPVLEAAAAEGQTRDGARALLDLVLERMVGFLVAQPEAGPLAQFILRELSHPTPALDIVYDGVFEPVHRRLCVLWATATGGEPESEATRLAVFTMIGQVVYFRIGREAVLRRMDWTGIGPAQAGRIVAVARRNLDAMLAAQREDAP